ncbi:MAG: TonB-dependent receptor [Bacteroidales bacterium]|nr:TonB-dependent receptor [Bacteroidales bacterium]
MKFQHIIALSLLVTAPMTAAFAAGMHNNEVLTEVQAGTIKVSGKVVDDKGETLPGVNVSVKGTTTGTITDFDGNFTLNAPSDAVIVFSFVGYTTAEMPVNGQSNIGKVILKDESVEINDIVVVGYGTQKKVDLTGSVAIVDADEMKKVSNSNMSTMLQGKVAGVNITTDGQPGADPSVRIRGLGSFGSTAPLYVIDGVPMGTTIRDFSPNDIETIQVLKDASAAAIYGSRAANGVIIITTKQGKKDQPMRIDYRGYVGMDNVKDGVYEVMNAEEYAQYLAQACKNSGDALPAGYDKSTQEYKEYIQGVDTDWFNELYKTGVRQNHNLNLSGGGASNTYNLSLDYFGQDGTIVGAGPNYDRFTARLNNSMDVKFLNIKTSVVYSHSKQNNMAFSNANEYVNGLSNGSGGPVILAAMFMPPSIKAKDPSTWCLDKYYPSAVNYQYDSFGYGTYYTGAHGDVQMTNPLLLNELLERRTDVDRVALTGTLNFDLFDMAGKKNDNHKLNYVLNLAWNKTICKDLNFIPSFFQSNKATLDKQYEIFTEGYRNNQDFLVENTLTYDGKFADLHHVNLVVGQTFQRERYHTLTGTGYEMSEPYYLQLNNAKETNAGTYESEHVIASFIGRLNYDYDGKYLLSGVVRRDGSSRLSSDDRWDVFPSLSLGWRIDREDFFPFDDSMVNLFKIRGSYGVLGNENIGEYQYMSTMGRGDYSYSFGGNLVTGSSLTDYVNTAIKWEKKKSTDIGLDIALFSNRLEFNFDWYKAVSEDLLYGVAVPAEAGVRNERVTMNAATMENSGLEFAATYRNNDHPVKFEVSANLSTLKNKVTSLGDAQSQNDGYCRTEVGDEVGRFFGLIAEGVIKNEDQLNNRVNDKGMKVFQQGAELGDIAYKDTDGDGDIDMDDRVFLGSGLPSVNYGLNARVEWNGIDLSVSTFGAAGFKALDHIDMSVHQFGGLSNRSKDLLNAWTPENSNSNTPRVMYSTTAPITSNTFSDRFLKNGSYLKIANIELGYNFKNEWFRDIISNVRFYVSAQNLHTFSKYKGYNIDFAGGTFTPGYNYCSYPSPRTFMAGLNFSF